MSSISNPKKLFLLIILGITFVNIIILITFLLNRQRIQPPINKLISSEIKPITYSESEYYNDSFPDIELISREGTNINLRNLLGQVFVIRFTQFHPVDFPKLLYLDYLHNKYKEEGLNVLFINNINKNFDDSYINSKEFLSPIIDDDGHLQGIFRSRLNELFIIGKDFKIKFKHNNASNEIIYRQVIKNLFDQNESEVIEDNSEIFNKLIGSVNFVDINTKTIYSTSDFIKKGSTVILLFTSFCSSCPINCVFQTKYPPIPG